MIVALMQNPKKKRLAPIPVRATREQIARIDRLSEDAGMSRSAFILWRVLDPNSPPPPQRRRRPIRDQQMIAQLLATLGASRLSSNISQLAKAANSGSLPIGPELTSTLKEAKAELSHMRRMLGRALGMTGEP